MISVIDMPGPDESIWWRGKRGFEVGFFPCECVEVIGDKVCIFCNCNFCRQVLSYLFERLLLLQKLISLLLQVPHGLNLPHSSATLPHLARFENIDQQRHVHCTMQCNITALLPMAINTFSFQEELRPIRLSKRADKTSSSQARQTHHILQVRDRIKKFLFQFLNSQELHLVTACSWQAEKARHLAGESLWLRPRRTSSQFWQRRWIYSPPFLF